MFSDPQTVTINAIAQTLPRTGSGVDVGSFTKDDGTVKLGISHTYGKRKRRVIRVDHQKIVPDSLNPAISVPVKFAAYLVVDVPLIGYTLAEQKQIVDGLTAYLTASTGANVTKLLGGES